MQLRNNPKDPARRKAVKDRNRDGALRRMYGIDIGLRLALSQWQQHRCAICGEYSRVLCLDHDHVTKKPRGLLCCGCNTALGKLEPTPATLDVAVKRMEKFNTFISGRPDLISKAFEYLNEPPCDRMNRSHEIPPIVSCAPTGPRAELPQRVLDLCDSGMKGKDIASVCGVSVATVCRIRMKDAKRPRKYPVVGRVNAQKRGSK